MQNSDVLAICTIDTSNTTTDRGRHMPQGSFPSRRRYARRGADMRTPKPDIETTTTYIDRALTWKKNVISTTAFFEHALRSESRRGNWGGEGWTLIEERDAN